ncbi:helix-turn-helix transcriptional regulator [Aestuariivirga litoralis]|uniref:helix-turn-helix transcriptional regulator n=1 Tax=Aestuariivirga litoralis TaxID=2650924 RepID=UPI0018C6EDEA|nr:AraC family transcriptional regulator [Aestuariivirga litoralis]MBG1233813.1 AraC family transcriptional regulator [Aestuariivirga litoralis]
MATPQFESPLDRATFRKTGMFGGFDVMSARFVHHSFAPHTHDELMIGVIHAGVKAFRRGRATQFAAPGNLSVVNPGEMHTGEREQGTELVYGALYLPHASLAAMFPDQPLSGSAIRQPVIEDPEIWQGLACTHHAMMAGGDDGAAGEALTWAIALLFHRYGTNTVPQSEAGCPAAIKSAIQFMQARAGDPISLEEVSKTAGIGLFHLIRLFRKHLGMTPHAYLTQIRISRSQQLLKLGAPIAQIALDVGFADQAHFTKRFKQLTGTSPAHYAKSVQ